MRTILTIAAIGLACLTASAQFTPYASVPPQVPAGGIINTNNGVPSLTFGESWARTFEAITTGSNWIVAPFFTTVRDNNGNGTLYGGGLAGIYNVSANAGTMLRVDYLDNSFYMVSANLQLQLPFDAFGGKARLTPFGFFGAAYAFGTDASDSVAGIVGAGWDIKFPQVSSHWSMAFDAEYWSDRPGVQWRFAPFIWKF